MEREGLGDLVCACCKLSNTGGGNDLGTRLLMHMVRVKKSLMCYGAAKEQE